VPNSVEFESVEPRPWWLPDAPIGLLNSAYYLLPGPYEWEAASRRERLFTWLIPPLGVVAWLATTGRLSSVIGESPYATLSIWLLMLLVLAMTDWRAMPRLAIAGASTLVLMSGAVDQQIREAGIPLWLTWVGTGAVCLALAARPYIFGVLPTVAACGLLSRLI
jgi:hypothetical protein